MRLKTLIIVGAGISLLITALLAAGLVWFTQNQSRLLREHYAADEFINGVYQLELLTSDYLLNHRQRAAEQWRLHFQSLQDASKRLSSVFPPRERDLINGNLDKLQQLFALTVESFGGGGAPGAVSSRQRILAGQLKTSIERVVSDVRHLSSDYATQFITFNAELRRFVWISFIVAAVLLGGLWLLVALRVIQPIHRLGMQIQHFAQDPDFRLENSRPDEVGDLSALSTGWRIACRRPRCRWSHSRPRWRSAGRSRALCGAASVASPCCWIRFHTVFRKTISMA